MYGYSGVLGRKVSLSVDQDTENPDFCLPAIQAAESRYVHAVTDWRNSFGDNRFHFLVF